jgi:predicted ribosome quality control (RQC) complex YloA/Tae2 family protein
MAGPEKRWNCMPESAHLISCEHKGVSKLEKQGEYERRVEAMVEQCDNQIEQFKADLEEAGPEQRAKYDEEIDVLIANREAVRRGLLRVTPEGDDLCSSCPDEKDSV